MLISPSSSREKVIPHSSGSYQLSKCFVTLFLFCPVVLGQMSEREVRKVLKKLGLDVINTLTKRTIEERIRSELQVESLKFSRAELIDFATDVAKELEGKIASAEDGSNDSQPVKKQKNDHEESKKKKRKVDVDSAKKSKETASKKPAEIDWSARQREALDIQKRAGWTLESFVAEATSAARPQLFCRRCGSLLSAPNDSSSRHLCCVVCKHNTPVGNVAGRQSVSRWTPVQLSKMKKSATERSTIAMSCENPKCDAEVVEYYQMQLRSADEGSTTFYECKKCGFKWNENN